MTIPTHLWVSTYWNNVNSFDPVVRLWANEECVLAHARELVRHSYNMSVMQHSETYIDAAIMDMAAEWLDGLGTEWESDNGEYFFRIERAPVWVAKIGGIKTLEAERADRGKMGRYHAPCQPHVLPSE